MGDHLLQNSGAKYDPKIYNITCDIIKLPLVKIPISQCQDGVLVKRYYG